MRVAAMSTATAHDDADLIPGTSMTRSQLRAVSDELILRQRQAQAAEYVRAKGREQSPATRKRISEKVAAHRKAQALEAGDLTPLREARFNAGLTQAALAEKALVDATVIQRLETRVASETSRLTLARLARFERSARLTDLMARACASGDSCAEPAGHGIFGRFCVRHAAFHAALHERCFNEHGSVRKVERPPADGNAPPQRLPRRERAARVGRAVHAAGWLSREDAASSAGVKASALSPVVRVARDERWIKTRGAGGYQPGAVVPPAA